MSKKRTTRKAAQDLALRVGAKVTTEGGESFNVNRKKARPVYKNKPQEKPVEKQKDQSDVVAAIQGASSVMGIIVNDLKAQIADLKMSLPFPPDRWEIDWIRDDAGFTKKTILTPIYNKNKLHS